MDVVTLAQAIANGVVFGSILALCAIGLSLVYGILGLSNFAHGDTLTFGAYVAFFFSTALWFGPIAPPIALGVAVVIAALALLDLRWPKRLTSVERRVLLGFALILAVVAGIVALRHGANRPWGGSTNDVLILGMLLSVAATVLLATCFEFSLWRPLRRRGATVLSLVIASLGLSFVLRNAMQLAFGPDQVSLERGVEVSRTYFGVHMSNAQWTTLGIVAVVVLGVHLLLARTRTGKAMRALADNRDLARVCGIDVDRVVLYVWILGAALVALAGVLLCLNQNNSLNINMGFGILIPIFAAVMLGGIGSAYGAMVGGFVVGLAMRLGPGKYDLAWAFIVLVAVLVFRPQGILGRKA